MKKLYSLLLVFLTCSYCWAQYPLVSIADIQEVSQTALSQDDDTSPLDGDTVRVRGIVVMDGNISQAFANDTREIWLRDGKGPWNGINIFGFNDETSPDDIRDLLQGDSVEILGVVGSYNGNTQLTPLTGTGFNGVQVLGVSKQTLTPETVEVGELNDKQRNNILTTGEQYEGTFIKVENVTVVSVDYFSGNTRVSLTVQDSKGNRMNISDRFLVSRLPGNGGSFSPPPVNTNYTSISGVLTHDKNGRGYELYPFKSSHYNIDASGNNPPMISGLTRDKLVPTSSEAVNISCTITDGDGIDKATLYYAIGVSNQTYNAITLTSAGNDLYQGAIPAQAEGSFVKYYVSATDNGSPQLTTNLPNINNQSPPEVYLVRDNGLTISDIQYTPFADGNSLYINKDVELEGVVTTSGSSDDLGRVFIQQEDANAWAGLWLVKGTGLTTLKVGDKIRVKGSIREDFGFTVMDNISNVQSLGTGTIDTVTLDPAIFTEPDFDLNEAYEGMLVKLENPDGDFMYVVDQNPDGPDDNYGEYRIGSDPFDPNTGCRVIACAPARGGVIASFNVSYVNDASFSPNTGVTQVVIEQGDSLKSLTGVIYYSFSQIRIVPITNDDFEDFNPIFTSTESRASEVGLQLYPNPTSGEVRLQFSNEIQSARWLSIIDLTGREVLQDNIPANSSFYSFSTSGMQKGQYIVRVRNANGTMDYAKLIVQ